MAEQEERFSFENISLITGMDVPRLQQRRKECGVPWHAKGYTAAEVVEIIEGVKLVSRHVIDGKRSRKAKELWYRLGGRKDDD